MENTARHGQLPEHLAPYADACNFIHPIGETGESAASKLLKLANFIVSMNMTTMPSNNPILLLTHSNTAEILTPIVNSHASDVQG